jgi:hypothetical protein
VNESAPALRASLWNGIALIQGVYRCPDPPLFHQGEEILNLLRDVPVNGLRAGGEGEESQRHDGQQKTGFHMAPFMKGIVIF